MAQDGRLRSRNRKLCSLIVHYDLGTAVDRIVRPWKDRWVMSETPTMPWGHLLKKHRLAAGLTQETLAERAGVGARTSVSWNGARPPRARTRHGAWPPALDLSADEQASFAAAATSRPRRRLSARSQSPSPASARRSKGVPRSSRETPLHNLPLQLTTFIGRAQEIVDLAHLLTSTRLLTLTGAGGVGKSRLALQVAERVLHRYPQGVWLVNVGPLSDPALVLHSGGHDSWRARESRSTAADHGDDVSTDEASAADPGQLRASA